MKYKEKWYCCHNIDDLCHVVDHNVDTTIEILKKLNNKVSYLAAVGIIFGTIIEFHVMEQKQKVKELEKKLGELNVEVEELKNKEGD